MTPLRKAVPMAALGLLLAGCVPSPQDQERTVRTLVFQKLSYADLPVVVGPAVMEANFALVDWTRGSYSGGRALLRRHGPQWKLIACAGAPLKSPEVMVKGGAPIAVARPLATKLLREEERLPADRQIQIDHWTGLGPVAGACPEVKP